MSVEIRGGAALNRKLERIARRAPDLVAKALYAEAEIIMADSKENYVPVAPDGGGTLRASGKVGLPEFRGANISVSMGYGGSAAPYAEAIHEHPSGASPPSWQGKSLNFHLGGDRRKYLEKPLLKAKSGLGRRLARRIDLERGA